MSFSARVGLRLAAGVIFVTAFGFGALAQEKVDPQYAKLSKLPNPYHLVKGWPTLPSSLNDGKVVPKGQWGEAIRVHLAPDGNIWLLHRCFNNRPLGMASCYNRGDANPPLLEFTPDGKLIKSIGVGLLVFPHGFDVDKDGNLYVTDINNHPEVQGVVAKDGAGVVLGQQMIKLSPDGKVLMKLGKQGDGGPGNDQFDEPAGVAVGPDGAIYVADGHGGYNDQFDNARIMKFSKEGKFIKSWGKKGKEPGNFNALHDIFVGGSKQWVYVVDRGNKRVQVFDQDGKLLKIWDQFGTPNSVFVDKDDNMYVGSGATGGKSPVNDRGIVVANAISGEPQYFIPDPGDLQKMNDTGSSASGVAVDDKGNLYAADVGENNFRKYTKSK
jgi:sugar lactone lactonase YvrE